MENTRQFLGPRRTQRRVGQQDLYQFFVADKNDAANIFLERSNSARKLVGLGGPENRSVFFCLVYPAYASSTYALQV